MFLPSFITLLNLTFALAPTSTPSLTPSPTPTHTPTPTPTPYCNLNLRLNEFMAYPAKNENEWVEIFNPTQASVDLNGWQLDDIEGGSSPWKLDGQLIKPQSYLVVEFTSPKLNNSKDSVRLIDPCGTVVDQFSYTQVKQQYSWSYFDSGWKQTANPTPGSENILPPTPTPTPSPAPSPTPSPFPTATPVTPTPTPTPTPPPPLLLIAEARQKREGTMVRIEGIISSPPEQLGSRVMYIEDESGGIKVLLDRKNRHDLKYEDEVEVTGKIGSAFNETFLRLTDARGVRVIGKGNLPDPLKVPTGKVGEENEGRLLQVNGQITATSGNTFYLNDGSGNVKVYIKDSTGIKLSRKKKGDYSQVTGINSQYREEYRLLPRFPTDVILSQTPIHNRDKSNPGKSNSNSSNQGRVLGASSVNDPTSLPQTAVNGIGDGWMVLTTLGLFLRRLLE